MIKARNISFIFIALCLPAAIMLDGLLSAFAYTSVVLNALVVLTEHD